MVSYVCIEHKQDCPYCMDSSYNRYKSDSVASDDQLGFRYNPDIAKVSRALRIKNRHSSMHDLMEATLNKIMAVNAAKKTKVSSSCRVQAASDNQNTENYPACPIPRTAGLISHCTPHDCFHIIRKHTARERSQTSQNCTARNSNGCTSSCRNSINGRGLVELQFQCRSTSRDAAGIRRCRPASPNS